MRPFLLSLVVAVSASAQTATCAFPLGFITLHDMIAQ